MTASKPEVVKLLMSHPQEKLLNSQILHCTANDAKPSPKTVTQKRKLTKKVYSETQDAELVLPQSIIPIVERTARKRKSVQE
jgi:hypothetical protein